MKKLNLKKLQGLGDSEVLSREQLKNVLGGNYMASSNCGGFYDPCSTITEENCCGSYRCDMRHGQSGLCV